MREHFHGVLLELICRQENCAERRMEEDLPARWDPTAASEWSGGPSQALAGPLAVPIQMWVLGLETCSHKILTWQRGGRFEPPDFGSALPSGEDQDQGSGSSSPAWAVGPILPEK